MHPATPSIACGWSCIFTLFSNVLAEDKSGNLTHLVENNFFNCAFGCRHIVLKVLVIHVGLPKFTGFPVFIEKKVGRVFVVLMQVVINTSFFSACDINQFQSSVFTSSTLFALVLMFAMIVSLVMVFSFSFLLFRSVNFYNSHGSG